jgi:Tfp pilus assembly protein PilW
MKKTTQSGFALAEFLVGSLATMVVLGATFTIMNQLVRANRGMAEVMSTRANVRVAMNMIARDITMAGTGLPSGSVGVPNGGGATAITRPGMAAFMAPDRDLETPGNTIPIVSTGSEDGPDVADETEY